MTRHFYTTSLIVFVLSNFLPSRANETFPPEAALSEVRSMIDAVPKEHPRLFAGKADLDSLKNRLSEGSLKKQVADQIVREAKSLLNQPPVTRRLQGRRLLGQSRRCVERVLVLSTAFHLTGDDRYAKRCEQEMLAAAAFNDWNPNHFLDVGEMTFALAVGYDWLHDALPAGSRSAIREAIVEKGLKLPFETRHDGWVKSRNNWGQVCHGGLTVGALAILEDEPGLAARTVHNALRNVVHSMEAYAPNGSYPEGPGYWAYGTTYNVLLIAALDGVFGTDFGLSRAPGFDRTGQYPALVTGPSGETFNYADGGAGRSPEPILFWFADRYNRNDWLRGEFEILRNELSSAGRFLPLALLWMDEVRRPDRIRMPLHWQSEGSVPISVHRGSWNDEDAVFVGFKGGSPSANHGQMDIGSFVLDADGARWALDLGAEGYHGIESRGMNLWDRSQDSDRWTIFRQMNHGHNTLVIDNQLQRANGFGRFEKFSDDPSFPHSVIDMTTVYEGQATSARRGVAMLPSKRVIVRDELKGLKPGAKVRWGMITRATPGRSEGNTLRLSQDNLHLTLELLSPAGRQWQTQDVSKPRREWDSPNPGATLVYFEAVAPYDGELTLQITATPGSADKAGAQDKDIPLRPLDSWQ